MDVEDKQMRTRILRSGTPGRRVCAWWERLSSSVFMASWEADEAPWKNRISESLAITRNVESNSGGLWKENMIRLESFTYVES
jgi:hypothetical protein